MVKSFPTLAILVGLMALTPAALPANPHAQSQSLQGNWKLLEDYCVECHNATDWAGGVAFDTMQPDTAADDAEIWEKAVRKLRGSLMPPPGKKQPDESYAHGVHQHDGRLPGSDICRPPARGPRRSASPEPHRVRERGRRYPRPAASTRRSSCRAMTRATASTTRRTC